MIEEQKVFDGIDLGDGEEKRRTRANIAAAHARRLARARNHRYDGEPVLYECAVADLHKYVDAGTVDLVLTDPPYPREYLECWRELGEFAAHALKDGGTLLALSGHVDLPDIHNMLGESLSYHWTMAWRNSGRHARVWPRRVNVWWKPVLWYQKGEYEGDVQVDMVRPPQDEADKDHHHWGQSQGGFDDLIARFASPGDTVCDPFLGGGTTALAAVGRGCRFIGADIDAECVETTDARLQR